MLLKTETYTIQRHLSDYCKTGDWVDLPGVNQKRLSHYHRLIYNIVDDVLSTALPITYKHVNRVIWDEMVHQFFSSQGGKSPQLWKLPFEFYQYVKEHSLEKKYQLPWLIDLLYFEWLEVELFMMEDIPYPRFKTKGDWLKDALVLNPENKLIKLSYPVYKSSPDKLDNKNGEYFLLMFREKDTGKVQFIALSVLHAYVLEAIQNIGTPLEEIIANIIYLFGINDMELLHNNLLLFLNDLKDKGFIVGFQ